MKVLGLDGREHSWNLTKSKYRFGKKKCSKNHKKARSVLKDLFPHDIILEEVTLPGSTSTSRKKPLYADFFLPSQKLMIEVHGAQHYTYNNFFYKTKQEFYRAKARDRDKEEWCDLNSINIVVLDHKATEDEWKQQINSR